MIRTQAELIQELQNNPDARLVWSIGNRPAGPGVYCLKPRQQGGSFTVHGNAANAAIRARSIKQLRADWATIVYGLDNSSVQAVANPAIQG